MFWLGQWPSAGLGARPVPGEGAGAPPLREAPAPRPRRAAAGWCWAPGGLGDAVYEDCIGGMLCSRGQGLTPSRTKARTPPFRTRLCGRPQRRRPLTANAFLFSGGGGGGRPFPSLDLAACERVGRAAWR